MGPAASPRLFGTDGIRAPFGRFPLDEPTVTRLGEEVGRLLTANGSPDPEVLMGGDTRASTPRLASWLGAGLRRAGARTRFAGVVPSPGIAFLTRQRGLAAGISISASHNLPPDNGIKLIDSEGFKWSVQQEAALEQALLEARSGAVGGVEPPRTEPELAAAYAEHLLALLPGPRPLAGLRIALDLAHGAATPFAPELFRRLGAEVEAICDRPDGENINAGCGSTHPERLAEITVDGGFHLGVAFDGDADRAVLIDERGEVRDGDAILFLWARDLLTAGELRPAKVVATSMSNLGLEEALGELGIEVIRCDVGDRVVVETMRQQGIRLGGEQSGHIVDLHLSSTGDGLITALKVAHLVRRSGGPLSPLLEGFRRFPQILRNLPVDQKPDLDRLPSVQVAAEAVRSRLGDRGRLVLRYSGTEPLARVMIEGPDEETIEAMAEELLGALRLDLAGGAVEGES
jgi:phosphoglucosamine mutase